MTEQTSKKSGRKFVIKDETRQRCKIFELDSDTKHRYVQLSAELFSYVSLANKIDFSVYFRIGTTMIEYMRPEEFSQELVERIGAAILKDYEGLEISIRKVDRPKFGLLIEEIRKRKVDRLMEAEPHLDRKVLEVFGNLSNASQLVVKGGVNSEVANQVERAAAYMVDNLFDSNSAMATLSKMVTHDPTLYDHSASVAMLAAMISTQHLKKPLSKREAQKVAQCGLYHDVGKTCVPSYILNKPGKFTPEEFEVMKTHAELGEQELMKIIESGAPIDPIAARVAGEHHERWTGKGYPRGRKGAMELDAENGIHLYTRIVSIADVYSALLMKRIYKPAYEPQDAILIMNKNAKEEYDPDIYPHFRDGVVKSLNKLEEVRTTKGRLLFLDDDGELKEIPKPRTA
jgi:HD-GYP domain-containing protein (c-di-GMP phosphodiesterase class II)